MMRAMYSCYLVHTPHILSSPSFIFLQAVEDCIIAADPEIATCLDGCFHNATEPTTCDEVCTILDTCHDDCFADDDTCKAEMYDIVDCHLTGVCARCVAADDAPPIESLALNLGHALKKNLRA